MSIEEKHILIVDDEEPAIRPLQRLLEKNKARVDYAETLSQALSQLKENNAYDLVLLDLRFAREPLPNELRDGFEYTDDRQKYGLALSKWLREKKKPKVDYRYYTISPNLSDDRELTWDKFTVPPRKVYEEIDALLSRKLAA